MAETTGVCNGLEKDEENKGGKDRPWADAPNDVLGEIYSRLVAGERVMFRCTCSSWNSFSRLFSTGGNDQLAPMDTNWKKLSSFPCLLFPKNRSFYPIYDKVCSIDYLHSRGSSVQVAKDGWFLMSECLDHGIYFLNPFTEEKLILPDINNGLPNSMYFSSPPSSANWFVTVAITRVPGDIAIYTIKRGDHIWRCSEPQKHHVFHAFKFSFCNPVFFEGLYYFLGEDAKLLIHNPKRQQFFFHEAPMPVSQVSDSEQYMLEVDGKILAVFVRNNGSSVHIFRWNYKKKWETVDSLKDKMVFVSRPLSFCMKATIVGTGNKIYFPRIVGSDRSLFYSLSTNRMHTFEMDNSYQSFEGSKCPIRATWWLQKP